MHTDFLRAFTSQAKFYSPASSQDIEWNGMIELVEIGRLILPTGLIVACDPFSMLYEEDVLPFEIPSKPQQVNLLDAGSSSSPLQIKEGKYPVTLSVAKIEAVSSTGPFTHKKNACVMIQFTQAVPVTLEIALIQGQNAAHLIGSEFFGYGVDSGVGCFMDLEAARLLYQRIDADENYTAKMMTNRTWENAVLDESSGLNVMMFMTGMGDGSYASYWGLDDKNNIACLVTDFMILGEPEKIKTIGT